MLRRDTGCPPRRAQCLKSLVLDASIALSWILGDEFDLRASTALTWLRSDEAFVPPIWHYEIRNAILVAERRGRVPAGESIGRLETLSELPINTDTQANLRATFELARMHDLSFYDGLYLELARRREAALATLDAGLSRAADAYGLEFPVD